MPISPLLASYEHILLDLDGCVWVGDVPTRQAPAALEQLRRAGKTVSFLTNDARSTPEEYVRKLWALGLRASLEEVVTVGSAIQHVLSGRRPRIPTYVIGAPAVFRHVADAGARVVNGTKQAAAAEIVVVAGHDDLRFEELRIATQAVLAGAEMLASCRDRNFPTQNGPCPGTGAIVAAIEYATERIATSVGKPEAQIFEAALDRLGPGRSLMIGDRLDSDLAGAAAAGIDGAIVLTGATAREQAQAATNPAPVAIAEDLFSLVTA
jgi:glycerol-1-phosphatase